MFVLPLLARRILLALAVGGALAFIWAIHEMLGPFLLALLLVYILNPLVDWLGTRSLGHWKVGRGPAVATVFLGFFGAVALFLLIFIPNLYAEGVRITRDMPQLVRSFEASTLVPLIGQVQILTDTYGIPFDAQESIKGFFQGLMHTGQGETASFVRQGQLFVRGVFSTVFGVVLVFMLTLFLLLDWQRIKAAMVELVPPRYRGAFLAFGRDMDRGLSGAVRGQLMVCLINGVLTTLGLLVLKVKFALTIGLIAGVFSLVPIFGTVISTVPAVAIALTQGWWVAIEVVIMIIVIHLIEANILNPNVVGHHSELHPVLVLFALMVGEHAAGAAGMLFAVPLAAIARSILRVLHALLLGQPLESSETTLASPREVAEV